MQIGFIGLGMMGVQMAHRLHAAGYRLVVRDSRTSVEDDFVANHSGTQAAHGRLSFAGCEVVITMLPDSDAVDAVLAEIADTLASETAVVDMSSSDPLRTRALAVRLALRGLVLIDAPVSGGVKKAEAGTLAIMVGGDPQVLLRLGPLLACLGQSITHVGPVGAGHALKALNNYVSAAALIATTEAIHTGHAFGLDPGTIVDVIQASTGRNNTTENKARQFMLSGRFDSGFSLALQAKDVGIAARLGPAVGIQMDLARQVSAMTTDASQQLGPAADHTELYRFTGSRRAA